MQLKFGGLKTSLKFYSHNPVKAMASKPVKKNPGEN